MGANKQKKERFLRAHQWCCFCGGGEQACTIDHVPNRACFLGRAFPETFEFPACVKCQEAARLDEIVFAHAVALSDFNPENINESMGRNALNGLINNLPSTYWPNPFSAANAKRAAFKGLGMQRPEGCFLSDLPILRLSPEFSDSVLRYTKKISVALYYRETSICAASDFNVVTSWAQAVNHTEMQFYEKFANVLPNLTIGSRPNLDFGDRFRYRSIVNEDKSLGAFLVQFGKGIVFLGVVSSALAIDIPDRMRPTTVARMFDGAPRRQTDPAQRGATEID